MQARARYFGGVGGRAGGGVEVGVVRGGGAGACGAVLGGLAKLDVVFGGGRHTGAVELSSVKEGVS